MTKREAAVMEVYTGTVMLEGDDTKYTQQYIEKLADHFHISNS